MTKTNHPVHTSVAAALAFTLLIAVLCLTVGLSVGLRLAQGPEVGGTTISRSLSCTEDELIGANGKCVHIDRIALDNGQAGL